MDEFEKDPSAKGPSRIGSPEGRTRKGSPDRRSRIGGPERRSRILAAAMKLFSEKGFHGTKTRDLAERAEVSEALLFRHFPDKDAIIRAIIDLAGAEERMRWLEESLDSRPPREVLRSIAEHVLSKARSHPDAVRVVFFAILEKPDLAREFYHRFLSRVLAVEARLFERAFAERTDQLPIRKADPKLVARSFHGSLLFYSMAGAVARFEPPPEDPSAVAEAIVSLYLPEVER
jgi:TetR/AcrR family transcriptional regulator